MIAEIEACRAELSIPLRVVCEALGVSPSWFYKHRNRPPTATRCRRDRLDEAIKGVFDNHDGEYGSPRIHAELIETSEFSRLSVNTVAQRMKALGLVAKTRPKRRSLTRPDKSAPVFENLLGRDFDPPAPDVVWCGDITEITTWEGKLYLAIVIDLYSRRLIGFAIAEHCKATLVADALKMAIATRGGDVAGVTFHSDRGSQYTSKLFRRLCRRQQITQSMSRTGSCLDNAVAEAFFATFKTELIYRVTLPTKTRARRQMIAWFDRYNRTRRHSHCGLQAPINYETKYHQPAAQAA